MADGFFGLGKRGVKLLAVGEAAWDDATQRTTHDLQ